MSNIIRKKLKVFSPVQIIVYSFVLIIAFGTFLLLLPISSRSGVPDFLTAFFTAVSCTCVTGLSLHDTWSYFSPFGQVVMLMLIQIGGLGLVSFTTGFTLAMHKKLDLREMKIIQEGTQGNLVDIPRIIRTIFISTFGFEILGALVLCSRFVPIYGAKGAWLAFFLAVSSYCNAGFDVTGFISPDSSVVMFNNDPLVMVVISFLIIIGGLGFLVLADIYRHFAERFNPKVIRHSFVLHSKVVIRSTVCLLLIGTLLFFSFEYEHALKGLSFGNKLAACFLQSASSRTAGLFAFDLSKQYSITKLITVILMFIGASPASTGGGVKTVPFVVVMSTMWSTFFGKDDTIIYRRRVGKSVVYKSVAICAAFVLFAALGTLMICILEASKPISSIDILYEVVSALSTTGVSAGITRSLTVFSQYILILFMFVGRVGLISLILALTAKKENNKYKMLPEGKLIIG